MNEEQPKGRISKPDIHIVLEFSSRVETYCAQYGDSNVLREAQTVQRIARMALYDANYEARRLRILAYQEEEYPYPCSTEEDEPVARFLARIPDEE